MTLRHLLCAGLLLTAGVLTLSAGPLSPISYSMLNGAHGSFNYRDFTYVPCGGICDITGSGLSGGSGKLTDGVIPAADWFAQGELTQWVGWDSAQNLANPSVTFYFPVPVTINKVSVYLSNSLSGGVALPVQITIGGDPFAIPADGNTSPRWFDVSGLSKTGSSLTIQFTTSNQPWVMVGEVAFDGTILNQGVPEPSTLLLLGAGLGLLAMRRRAG